VRLLSDAALVFGLVGGLGLGLGLGACGDAADATPDAGPHVDAGAEPPSLGEVYVTESVDRSFDGASESRRGSILGSFRGGPEPAWHQVVADDGTCRLLEYVPGHCDAYCEGVCSGRNVCTPYPGRQDAGTLTLTGITGAPLVIEPQAGVGWYFPAGVTPAELFADDAIVGMSLSGSATVPALHAETRAVPRLVADVPGFRVTLHDDQDFVVHWTAADDPAARVRLTLNANNQTHGAPYDAILVCETADAAGQIRVPKAMIAAFPATDDWEACAGSDCPRSALRRFTRAFAPVPGGAVRLDVGSAIGLGVVHQP
jgi:hypothetical protein